MSKIKTDLRKADTAENGNVDLYGKQAFAGVFKLGLILGSKDPHSQQLPTDEKGLENVKGRLDNMMFECLIGLSGIGAIIGAADPAALTKDDLDNIGSAISNLSLLGIEAQNHIESIEIDLHGRRGHLTHQKRGAL